MSFLRKPHSGRRVARTGRRLAADTRSSATLAMTMLVRLRGLFACGVALAIVAIGPGSFGMGSLGARHSHQFVQTPVQRSRAPLATGLQLRASRLTREIRALTAAPQAPHANKAKLTRRLVALSRARERVLIRLLAKNPQAARRMILPTRVRHALAHLRGARVETQIQLEGRYRTWHQDDFKDPSRDVYLDQLVTLNGKRVFTLHGAESAVAVSLTFARLKPNTSMSVRGYALGGHVLATQVQTTAGRSLAAASTSTATSVGPITTAVITANFADSSTSIDLGAIKANFQGNPGADVVSYFNEASYGKASIVPSFYGPYTLSQSTSLGCGDSNLTQTMMNAANADVNYTQFKRLIFVVNCSNVVGAASNEGPVSTPDGTVTAAQIMLGPLYATKLYYVVHELSHTLGSFNGHANFFVCLPDAFSPPTRFDVGCESAEYGDEFDVLGGGMNDPTSQLDPYHKANAGWFGAGQFPTISSPGTYTYTLAPYENPTTGVLALNIPRGQSGTSFTVEYRQALGFDSWMGSSSACPGCTVTQGASIRLANFYTPGGGGGGDTQLIDTTPGSIRSRSYYPIEDGRDGALQPGKTFTDPEYGISITAQSITSAGLTVQITVPIQPCTHAAPRVAATSLTSATAVAGQPAVYTFTLTNTDSTGCPANRFRYFPDYTYPDVTMVASPDWLTLAPGASATVKLSVTSAQTTVDGNYSFQSGAGQFVGNSLDAPGTALPSISYLITSPLDTSPPSAPTNLTARTLGSSVVALAWSPSTDNLGVMGYKIRRSDGYIFDSQTASLTDTLASPGVAYSYSVQALDRKNNLSPTASVSMTTPTKTDFTPPSAPVVTASATDHSVTVSWSPSSDNVGVAYYSVRPCLVKSCSVPATQTSFTAQGLPSRTRYDIQILAYDRDGNYSNWGLGRFTVYTAAAGTSAPSQPDQLMSSAGTFGRIDLSWRASSDDKGVAGYDIYRNNRKLATVTSTSFSDTTVAGNSEYYVQAVDGDGSLSAPSPRVWFLIPGTAGSDTSPPTADMSDPSGGSTVSGTVTVGASASDDAGVAKVELYVDGALKGTDTTAPYSFSWDTTAVVNGPHWMYVKAYDAAGNYGSSSARTVNVDNGGGATDTTPPTVALTAPGAGSTVSGAVNVSASASDNVGVSKVEFSVDGSPLATATGAPYGATWNASSASAGVHTLAATAYDAAGNSSTSSVDVTVPAPSDTTPPAVSITAPANGATVSGFVSVTAAASDNVGVTNVELSVDGSLNGALSATPYSFGLDTTTLAAGSHTLTMKASDAAGNSSSAQATVTVQSAPADTTLPKAPSGLKAAVTGTTQVALFWTPSTDNVGVVGYDVYRDGAVVAQTSLPNYLDSGLLPGTSHAYSVRARDAAGNTSSASSNLNARTPTLSTASTGTLAGVLYTSLGRPAANMIVQLTGNGITKSAKTNNTGAYKFSSLPPGEYTLTIGSSPSSPGAAAAPAVSATVISGQTIVLVGSP